MSVIYRKYRPQLFSEVVGQEHVVKTLTNALSKGMISHAYLFSGPRGCGKTTIARLLAKAINCEDHSDFEPCGKCLSCLEIKEGRSMDLIEIDAASNRGIDDVKELREGARFAPTRLKYKVFILDEAHQLSKDAANALLKILEEPPAHVVFILATTEAHKMIPTIVSRCQRFDFKKFTVSEIISRLETIIKNEKAKVSPQALSLIASHADGALRDAESLLDQVLTLSKKEIDVKDINDLLGLVETESISRLIDLLIEKKAKEAVSFLDEVTKRGVDIDEFAKAATDYLRQVLILKLSGESDFEKTMVKGFTKEEFEKMLEQAKRIEMRLLRKGLNLLIDAENKMRYASIPQLVLELAIIELCEEVK